MIRIMTTRRLRKVLAANNRLSLQHARISAEKRQLETDLRLAARENAALLLENQILFDQRSKAGAA